MPNLPVHFNSEAIANKNFEEPWVIKSSSTESQCAIPPEFGGHGGGFSPEDLFLQAAINCFLGTFKVMARLSKISFDQIQVQGNLSVDKNEENKTVMKSVHLNISFSGVDRPDRVETLVAKVIKDGFILNSIKSDITYNLNIVTSDLTSSIN